MEDPQKRVKNELVKRMRGRVKRSQGMQRRHHEWIKGHFNRGDIIEIKKETKMWREKEIWMDQELMEIEEGPIWNGVEPVIYMEEDDIYFPIRKEKEEYPEGTIHIEGRKDRIDRKMRKELAKKIYGSDVILTPNRHYTRKIPGETDQMRSLRILHEHEDIKKMKKLK